MIVVYAVPVAECDKAVVWGKSFHASVVESKLGVNQTTQWISQTIFLFQTPSNKSPSGLVVMPSGRVDNGNVVLAKFALSKELMANGEASRTGADYHDLMISSVTNDRRCCCKFSACTYELSRDRGPHGRKHCRCCEATTVVDVYRQVGTVYVVRPNIDRYKV